MADIQRVEGETLSQAIQDGYTPIFTWIVEYDDGRQVEVPSSRYLDVVQAERHFKAAYDTIKDREEVMSWLLWKRLSRHQDANEHPPDNFEEWLASVSRPQMIVEIDREEDAVPLASNPEGGN